VNARMRAFYGEAVEQHDQQAGRTAG